MKKHNNGEFRVNNIKEEVTLKGWVAKKRNLGGLIFIDLRDRSGIIQLVIRPENSYYELANTLKSEYVIEVTGNIVERESKNPKIPTGDIEVAVDELIILNEAKELPFEINDQTTASEELRLKYRYLDLRRDDLKNNLLRRHRIVTAIRSYLNENYFVEVETPILCKSTPEGARDYLVPSRVSKGKFYALPQSPQIFKQLLMVGGLERYYQIARCFRDEDLRADRQPEFTQIDIEMSFIEEIDIQNMVEGIFKKVFKDVKNIELETPFERLTYNEAMARYGSDKPDTRFDLELTDITDVFSQTEISMIKDNKVNAIVVNNEASNFSRKRIDELDLLVKTHGAKGLMWLKYENKEFTGSIAKNLLDKEREELVTNLKLNNNDIIFIIADKLSIIQKSLGALRLKLGSDLNLIDENKFNFLWVIDFPLFEYDEEEGRYYAKHHPFTSPKLEDMDKLKTDPDNCYARAYDIVLNGYELGGGSIRIHKEDIQNKAFEALGLTKEEINNKFGFLINAFKYGTPPHGGIALGIERITMLLSGTDNIKDVLAFPKTASASDLMTESPSSVDNKQLKELGIKIDI